MVVKNENGPCSSLRFFGHWFCVQEANMKQNERERQRSF